MLGGLNQHGILAKATEMAVPASWGCQPIIKALVAICVLLGVVGGCTLFFSE